MTAWRSGPLIQNGVNGNLPLTLWQRMNSPDGRPQQPSLTQPYPEPGLTNALGREFDVSTRVIHNQIKNCGLAT